jgi:hypothetical protein
LLLLLLWLLLLWLLLWLLLHTWLLLTLQLIRLESSIHCLLPSLTALLLTWAGVVGIRPTTGSHSRTRGWYVHGRTSTATADCDVTPQVRPSLISELPYSCCKLGGEEGADSECPSHQQVWVLPEADSFHLEHLKRFSLQDPLHNLF